MQWDLGGRTANNGTLPHGINFNNTDAQSAPPLAARNQRVISFNACSSSRRHDYSSDSCHATRMRCPHQGSYPLRWCQRWPALSSCALSAHSLSKVGQLPGPIAGTSWNLRYDVIVWYVLITRVLPPPRVSYSPPVVPVTVRASTQAMRARSRFPGPGRSETVENNLKDIDEG